MADNSQKFIARNRAPRVQIEYDVELYGAEKKVQLPFVMGVMSDLVGKSKVEQPSIADRKFLEIDVDNFDERMRAMAPRAAFTVPNTLTGEGNLAVDLTFESLDDFTPGAIASKVDALKPLLQARQELTTLMAYMDGKAGAEALVEKILQDPNLLSGFQPDESAPEDLAAVLDELRAQTPEAEEGDATAEALASLAAAAPVAKAPPEPDAQAVLDGLAASAPAAPVASDTAADVLSALADAAPEESAEEGTAAGVLDALRAEAPADVADDTLDTDDVLARVAQAGGESDTTGRDEVAEAFAGLAATETADAGAEDPHAAEGVLDALRAEEPSDTGPVQDEADDILAGIAQAGAEVPDVSGDDVADILGDLAAAEASDPAEDLDAVADVLEQISAAAPQAEDGDETDLSDVLADLAEAVPVAQNTPDAAAETLAALAEAAPEEAVEAEVDLGDLLADLDETPSEDDAGAAGVDDILAGLSSDVAETSEVDDVAETLAALTEVETDEGAGDDLGLDDLLGELTETETTDEPESAGDDAGVDVDDILADLGIEDEPAAATVSEPEPAASVVDDLGLDDLLGELGLDDDEADTGLDDLLSDIETADQVDGALDVDLDDLLADAPESVGDDLAGLLDGLDADGELADAPGDAATPARDAIEFPFGTMSAERPAAEQLKRRRFRIAVLGDFSGRAAKGMLGLGDDLANRPAQLLDVDTVEEVIEGFAGDLALPIGKDGAVLNVPLGGLDDLHPDELYEKLDLFSELAGLKQQLASGATAEHAANALKAWGEKYGTPAAAPRLTSSATSVPADLRLSDFQRLIGDTTPQVTEGSPVAELLERVVGPYIRALPDPNATAMADAVTQSLTHAMRMVLHHPEFQAVEAQWRTLDLMARSIQTDDTLELMLYDVSAEELAADLAAEEDLTQSGFLRLLTEEPMDPELGRGGYSAVVGLYTFEETPPHAELLGRLARVAAHIDAPFLTAIAPTFLASAKEERPKLVAEAWDTLAGMSEASHLGLVSPRFLLRRPYGAKTDPIYEFDFEEFSQSEGLSGMLWGNPVALAAILMARSFKENGAGLNLGSIMSLGEMPYHYVLDRFGDQVALPCTERNIDLDKIAAAKERGYMTIAAVKGRDEIRLTSFMALTGGPLAGPWSGIPVPPPSPPKVAAVPEPAADEVAQDIAPAAEEGEDLDAELDALLAGFDDTTPDADVASDGDDDFDAELAALLDDL